jgi:chromate transporter
MLPPRPADYRSAESEAFAARQGIWLEYRCIVTFPLTLSNVAQIAAVRVEYEKLCLFLDLNWGVVSVFEKAKELGEIFLVFFKIGALTFGGGYTMLPLLQKDIVQKREWANSEEIIDYYAISQSLPGIIAVNTSMLVGYKKGKIPGLAASALGITCPSIIIILIIAMFITNFLQLEIVGHAFSGIRVAVAVLIVNATVTMWKSGVKDKAGVLIFLTALLVFTFAKISPILPIVAGAVAGIVLKERTKVTQWFISR